MKFISIVMTLICILYSIISNLMAYEIKIKNETKYDLIITFYKVSKDAGKCGGNFYLDKHSTLSTDPWWAGCGNKETFFIKFKDTKNGRCEIAANHNCTSIGNTFGKDKKSFTIDSNVINCLKNWSC